MKYHIYFSEDKIKELLIVVNDVCNSHCQMCQIWRLGNRSELSLAEFRKIFSEARFNSIELVRLTGGEPTLRKDLPEIAQAMLNSLPNLKSVTLETNAVELDQVWGTVGRLQEVFKASGKTFVVDIALDGVEAVHDTQRGVLGNFASAVSLIGRLKSAPIPFSIQSTLTPANCEQADDLLLWLDENKIAEFRFRLGGEIARYYTEGYFQYPSFTPAQKFHLIGFFDKLAHRTRHIVDVSYYYRALADQLSKGATDVWPLVDHGMLLDCDGSVSLSSNLHGSAFTQEFTAQMPEQAKLTHSRQRLFGFWKAKWRNVEKRFDYLIPIKLSRPTITHHAKQWQKVLITGWYGTETTGDKAILGEIIHCLKSYNPNMQFVITTIDEKVSRQTNQELDLLDHVELIPIEYGYQPRVIRNVDAVIMGGGPLMDSGQLENVWKIFLQANKQGISKVIFGCGVGPIRGERAKRLISDICHLADAGFYRDEKSHAHALKLGGNPLLTWACDPSLGFLARWRKQSTPEYATLDSPSSLHLTGLFREQTKEYYPSPDLAEKNLWFARQIAGTFNGVSEGFSAAEYDLLPMHMYWKGNDDRIFNRKIARECSPELAVNVVREYLPIGTLLDKLSHADVAMPMRYHGHLFSLALGIPFLSVNYTNKDGKVGNLLEYIGYQDYVEDFDTFDSDRACQKVKMIYSRRGEIREQLLLHTDILVERLNRTYEKTFGAML